jgi:hypothetical protein
MRGWIVGGSTILVIVILAVAFGTRDRDPVPGSQEDQVERFLPKDRGLRKSDIRLEEVPRILVVLRREPAKSETLVVLNGDELGSATESFTALDRRIAELHEVDPDLPGAIYVEEEVTRADVVRVIDAFMKCGVTDLTLHGVLPPEMLRDR